MSSVMPIVPKATAQRADLPYPFRIALLNPNTSTTSTELMLASARQVLPRHVSLVGYTAHHGLALIDNPDALHAAGAMMLPFTLDVVQGSAEPVDAVIVAGFGDPGLMAIRQRLAIPVTGIAEAGIAEAAQGGRRYAIVTVTPELHDSLAESAHTHGQAGQLASIRFTEGALDKVMASPESLEAALLQACQRAMTEDAAQAIVIGGGPLARAAAALAKRLHIPVIDPVAAAARLAHQRCLMLLNSVA